ncbi:MAG TPA: hypothetical protein VFU43_03765 [Streptosporangiaceae bacterium]|nr:hypothetical protein [Streptosporangiaceae bacterium]
MTQHHELRWGGIAGLGYAVLAIVAYFLPGTDAPRIDDSPATIVAFFADHRAQVLAQALLLSAAAALLVWFAAALAQTLRDRAQGSDLPGALLGGIILLAALTLAGAGLYASLAYRVGAPTVMIAAFNLAQMTYMMYGVAAAVPFTALAIGIHRTRVLPEWMGWFAAVCAVLGVVGALFIGRTSGAFVPGGPVASLIPFVADALFVIAASVFMVREHLPVVGAAPQAMGHA